MSVTITSDTVIPLECHFRVSAGPGAGKTYWLIKHIQNCLRNSERFKKARKIACITYTNVASKTILDRLTISADKVEVSTIHSFLYKHIVKPYAFFLQQEYGLQASEIDGHDDVILSNYGFLQEWKLKTGQSRIRDDQKIIAAFKDLRWKFDTNGHLVVRPRYPQKIDGYNLKNDSYGLYKSMCWKQGVIHHDDVLFFSYELVTKYPFILAVLRAKFPYFFIDEFQDSNPIQVEIIRLIGQEETIVGVIGDEAQSIYSFQGASHSQFFGFNLTNLSDYNIADNRRSTNLIIDTLYKARTNFQQNKIRGINGVRPQIVVGAMDNAINHVIAASNDVNVYSLSRDNLTSNLMKRHIGGGSFIDNLLEKLIMIDAPSQSNKYRSRVVVLCLRAVELAMTNHFQDAIKTASLIFPRKMDKFQRVKKALNVIMVLLSKYDNYKNGNLYDFYLHVKTSLFDLSTLRNGVAKTFYDSHSYIQVAVCVKINDDDSLHRTIHKAKGAEFKSVMLVLQNEVDLAFLISPDLTNEEHRVNYVAISRAIDFLSINVPSLSSANQNLLSSHFDIVTC